ncbi:MAG TPA: SusC/RagA family TonB-linked outer membrane protein [Bacteroidales bacterium]|nr:SusC/RagA family TonB-linked outer membrane protein [Bacteroidales bacterium]
MKRSLMLMGMLLFMSASLFGQTIRVTGTVTDAIDRRTLPGVSIMVQGTTQGTVTDVNGRYEISVAPDAVLVFSFIGMESRVAAVGGRNIINVVLNPEAIALEEVIVSGVAGATDRRQLSITVERVGTEALQAVPATSVASALHGKLSGITIVQPSGNPGQAAAIRLRGATSLLGDSEPLIIVDGIMIGGTLADINVDDIESIEVVKGAAASALYGSRAGAGVIVISSKRGSRVAEGTTSVRIRNEFGISHLPRKVPLAQHHAFQLAPDWQNFNTHTRFAGVTFPAGYAGGRNAAISGTRIPTTSRFADQPYARLFDHQDAIFQDGQYFTNYIGVAHNSGRSAIFSSFENTHNSGIVWNTEGSRRQNFRLNADHWIGEKISLQASAFLAQSKMDMADGRFIGGWGGGQGSAFFDMLFFEPDIDLSMDAPAGFALPKFYIHPSNWQVDNGNPMHALYYANRDMERRNVMLSFSGNYYATDWLNFNVAYSLERTNTFRTDHEPRGFSRGQQINTNGLLYKYTFESVSQTYAITANLNRRFGELLLRSRLSYLYEDFTSQNFWVNAANFTISGVPQLSAISGANYNAISSGNIVTRARNFFAIVDASFRDRYIFSGLFRYDGSSLFGANHRWNPYFRVSAAYRVSEDIDIPGIDEFRIRAAYGTSGIRPGFAYQYETYAISQGVVSKQTIGNRDLRPSESAELEVGLNLEFLGAFDFEATYAETNTKGAFYNVPLPASTGFAYQWQNAADLHTTALEFSLGAHAIRRPDFNWYMKFNFDRIRQKVTRLDAPPFRVGPTINDLQVFYIREGETFGMMYGGDWVRTLDQMARQLPSGLTINDFIINSDGFVIRRGTEGTINELPIRLLDENGREAFTQIADMNPDFNLTFLNNFTFRGWNLNMVWHWKQGGDIYNQTKQWLFRDERHGMFDQAGKPENQKKATTYYQAFYRVNEPNSFFVEDGTFLKLREASLYYNLNRTQLQRLGINFLGGVRFGVIGRNLLTFTNYSGWDPEVSQADYATGNPSLFSVDMFNYPNFRMITFNLELNF